MKNSYTQKFIDSCTKTFLKKLYTPKAMKQNVPKRNVFIKLFFLGSTSFQIRQTFQKLFIDKLTSCHLKVVFTSPVRVKAFSPSRISYLRCYFQGFFTCMSKVRICEHLGISHLTEKR